MVEWAKERVGDVDLDFRLNCRWNILSSVERHFSLVFILKQGYKILIKKYWLSARSTIGNQGDTLID